MKNPTYKAFTLPIPNANQEYYQKFKLDTTVKKIVGLAMSASKYNQAFVRGSQQLLISGIEVYPAGYESKMLMFGVNVPPADRYTPVEFNYGNGEIEIRYRDTNVAGVNFDAYTITLFVKCEV